MLVPLSWLREYIDISIDERQLAERLTSSGSSVERIHRVGEGLDDLIVAKVESVEAHPNADRLRVAQVNTGSETFEVVCGAPNLAAGQHIVFAPVGAQVPVDMHDDQRRPFRLSQAKIRGVVSHGMICSSAELGLGDDHTGILVLPQSTKIGAPVADALGYPQIVFDIEVTTNRVDELSMIGIAREISALIQQPLKTPEIAKVAATEGQALDPVINSDDCFRMLTQSMEVAVGPSPWWIQQRLSLSGMRPINNVVDITNYVMLEYGQPLHAYDTRQLEGGSLIARQAEAGEQLTTLDGAERKLTPSMLVIADAKKVLGIAGIMGGVTSRTDESTKHITLEAACFDPVSVRKTANALALRSEASRRFERMVDRSMSEEALDRAVDLLAQFAEGKRIGPKRDAYPHPQEAKQVSLSEKKLNQYLGKQFDFSQASDILNTIGFRPVSQLQMDDKGHVLTVNVPSWRLHDVDEEVDLIEEVVRLVGYDQIPVTLPAGELPGEQLNSGYRQRWSIKTMLTQGGWLEALTNSLTADDSDDHIAIANPLSSEWTHLRKSILPGLLDVARRNRSTARLPLFELSTVYIPEGGGLPQERINLALLYKNNQPSEQNYTLIKGLIEVVLKRVGLPENTIEFRPAEDRVHPVFDSRDTAAIFVDDRAIGAVGKIDSGAAEQFDLFDSTILAEIDMTNLLGSTTPHRFAPLAKYPAVEEDMSLLMKESAPVGPIIDRIKDTLPLVESVLVTETYRGDKLGQGFKAPLLHITYRSQEGTLTADQISAARQAIFELLTKEDIHVRE